MTTVATGYAAALEGVALFEPRRRRFAVSGRAPVQMLNGILTSRIPGPEAEGRGEAVYSVVLTPKGRLITDLRVLRTDTGGGSADAPRAAGPRPGGPAAIPSGEGGHEELLLDVPEEGVEGLLAHFTRFLPPRFAKVEDVSEGTSMITVVGPEAAGLLSLHALGLRVEASELEALVEGAYVVGSSVRVIRSADVAATAFDVVGEAGQLGGLKKALTGAGAVEVTDQEWGVLEVEAGRPRFGVDMDEDTIPIEAGLDRAIDHGKGCYTGQEVIVRIRDRGHVNRRLCGLRLEGSVPGPGTELHAEVRGERGAGRITRAVVSPRMGPVALAYVRREVEREVRVGAPDGPTATVVPLDEWGPA